MDSGVNYIVNNTGIPTSEWGKYKPAGVNPDGPSVGFFSEEMGRGAVPGTEFRWYAQVQGRFPGLRAGVRLWPGVQSD